MTVLEKLHFEAESESLILHDCLFLYVDRIFGSTASVIMQKRSFSHSGRERIRMFVFAHYLDNLKL